MTESPLVAVVDDDESVRESLPDLLRMFGFSAQAFASAEAFLQSGLLDDVKCLVLDVAMPSMSGPELQQELIRRGIPIPVVFISAQASGASRARLLALGAVAFVPKPFSDTDLLAAIKTALEMS